MLNVVTCVAAYEVLSNADKRREYDQFGEKAFEGGAGGGYDFDFNNFFKDFDSFRSGSHHGGGHESFFNFNNLFDDIFDDGYEYGHQAGFDPFSDIFGGGVGGDPFDDDGDMGFGNMFENMGGHDHHHSDHGDGSTIRSSFHSRSSYSSSSGMSTSYYNLV